jgi:hypothetical protein
MFREDVRWFRFAGKSSSENGSHAKSRKSKPNNVLHLNNRWYFHALIAE